MGLKTEEITLVWNGYIKNNYINKGYIFTANGDEFKIKVEDLPPQSHEWVNCDCDICGKSFPKQYYAYTRAFNNGGIIRCEECKSLKHKRQKPKYNYDEVKLKCEELGFELISKETGTFKDFIQVKCIHHSDIIQNKKISAIFNEDKCIYCSRDKDKHSYSYVQSIFEENGCTLLSKTYLNIDSELEFICNKHPFEIQKSTLMRVTNHQPCKYCQTEEQSERQGYDIEFIREHFKSKNCELISKEYTNNSSILQYVCNNHKEAGVQTTTFHTFRLGNGCPLCSNKRRSGINHPLYNPNLSDEDRSKDRKIPGYTAWRRNVYKRDNYTCQICGACNGKINAHHLDGYAENPDKRIDVDNGITLCTSCHIEFHLKYSKINTTSKQFKEFKLYKQPNILPIKEAI